MSCGPWKGWRFPVLCQIARQKGGGGGFHGHSLHAPALAPCPTLPLFLACHTHRALSPHSNKHCILRRGLLSLGHKVPLFLLPHVCVGDSEWDAPTIQYADQRLGGRDGRGRDARLLSHTEAQAQFKEFIRNYRVDAQFVLRCVEWASRRRVGRLPSLLCRRWLPSSIACCPYPPARAPPPPPCHLAHPHTF